MTSLLEGRMRSIARCQQLPVAGPAIAGAGAGRSHRTARRLPALRGAPGAAVVGIVAVTVTLGPLLALAAAGVAVALPRVVRWAKGDPLAATSEAVLAQGLTATARATRGGASLAQALREAGREVGGPLGHDLEVVAGAPMQGIALAVAADRWRHRRADIPGVGLAAAAVALAAETGGAPAQALDGVAATLRERAALQAEARAMGAQARYSGWVIAASPLVFTTFASLADPRVARTLFTTPPGQVLLVVGLVLDGLGAAWMNRITAGATR